MIIISSKHYSTQLIIKFTIISYDNKTLYRQVTTTLHCADSSRSEDSSLLNGLIKMI